MIKITAGKMNRLLESIRRPSGRRCLKRQKRSRSDKWRDHILSIILTWSTRPKDRRNWRNWRRNIRTSLRSHFIN